MDAPNTPAAVVTPKCICTLCKRESHDGYHEPFFECLSRMWREGSVGDRFSTVFFLPALVFLQLHGRFFRNSSYCCGAPLAGDPGPRRMKVFRSSGRADREFLELRFVPDVSGSLVFCGVTTTIAFFMFVFGFGLHVLTHEPVAPPAPASKSTDSLRRDVPRGSTGELLYYVDDAGDSRPGVLCVRDAQGVLRSLQFGVSDEECQKHMNTGSMFPTTPPPPSPPPGFFSAYGDIGTVSQGEVLCTKYADGRVESKHLSISDDECKRRMGAVDQKRVTP